MKYLNPSRRHDGKDVVVVPENDRHRSASWASVVQLTHGDAFDIPAATNPHLLYSGWAEENTYGSALAPHADGIEVLQDGIYAISYQLTTNVYTNNHYRRIDSLRYIGAGSSLGTEIAVVRSYSPSIAMGLLGHAAGASLTRQLTAGDVLGITVYLQGSDNIYLRRVTGENFFTAALIAPLA